MVHFRVYISTVISRLVLTYSTLLSCPSLFADNTAVTLSLEPLFKPEILLRTTIPLTDFISNQTGLNIVAKVHADYHRYRRDIDSKKLDLFFTSHELAYKIINQSNYEPMVTCKAKLAAVIFSKAGNELSLSSLKGHTIALPSQYSLSSVLAKKMMKDEFGYIDGENIQYTYIERPKALIMNIIKGKYKVGAASNIAVSMMGRDIRHSINLIDWSKPLSSCYGFIRKSLPSETKSKIRHALITFENHPSGRQFYTEIPLDGMTSFTKQDELEIKHYGKIFSQGAIKKTR